MQRREVCCKQQWTFGLIARERRRVHGFLFYVQAMHELVIRQRAGRQVDICGVLAQVFGCKPSTRPSQPAFRHSSDTLLDWAAHSATQQRGEQGSAGFTLQFVGSAFSLRLLQALPGPGGGWLACLRCEAASVYRWCTLGFGGVATVRHVWGAPPSPCPAPPSAQCGEL